MGATGDAAPPGALYRAFWRWHFYAGLAVLPVLMLMALTGGLYLFQPEIDAALDRPMAEVPPAAAWTPPSQWRTAAESAGGGRMLRLTPPSRPGEAARIAVASPAGGAVLVFVDPADVRVTGRRPEVGIMQWVKRLHSLDIAGPILNIAVEIVAGWSIVLVATGLVLWWPRGGVKAFVLRGPVRRRLFWRDLHASIGVLAGAVILFLAVTGMPWSAVWGDGARNLINDAGLGRPKPPAASEWRAAGHEQHRSGLPWTLQDAGLAAAAGPSDVDRAYAMAEAAHLARPYTLIPPDEPGGTWTASHLGGRVEATRALYLAPAERRVIDDIDYARFGAGAKAVEWGIAVHQGQQYGLANKLVMLFGCLAIWALGLSGLWMWWARRPKSRLAAPARVADRRATFALACAVGPPAVIFPLVGVSLAVVLLLDLAVRAFMGAAKESAA